ncbi:MAG TPA: PKD-like domain-containing protein, partial [Mucilaginibacter sp.]|nr:PKD-like domain-containing protein [Mucilaginibacter sp.]
MRKFLFLCFLFITSFAIKGFGQTTTFNENFTGHPDTSVTVTSSRNGNSCGGSDCIIFNITLDPGSDLLNFDIQNPHPNGASAYYILNCDGIQRPLNVPICVTGSGPLSITYCKVGMDAPYYTITASSSVKGSANLNLRQLCSGTMSVTGLTAASTTWTSIYPGAAGTYNSYLSCTSGCLSTTVTPGVGAPAYIDYQASGTTTCAGTKSATIRVYTYTAMTVAITPTSPSICNGAPVNLTASASGGNPPYTFSWSNGQTGAVISTSTAGTYTVTVTDNTTSCPGAQKSVTVTASPTPTVNSASSGQICNNTAQNYTIGSTVPGTTYSWSRATVANISNLAASGTSSTITEALNNTSTAPVTVTYAITPTANGCAGPVFNYTVTVNPTPIVNSAASATLCNNTAQNYNILSNVAGTTFTWSRAAVAGINGGAPLNGTTSSITETLTNSTNIPVTVTYAITPTANGCAGPVFNYTVTVNPTPIVNSAASATLCNNTAQNYNILSNVAGTTFTWSWATVANISNLAVSGQTSSTITEALVNTTNTPVAVTYVITPTANGCTGPAFNYTVTVNPTPIVNSLASATLCNNTAQNYNILSNVAGTTFTWSRATVANISNLAVSGQTTSTITEALVNTTNTPVAVTYVITPTANGCTGPAFNYTVTVNPTPAVNSLASATLCNGAAQNYTIGSNVAGTTFTWSRAAVAGINGGAPLNGTTSSITETLTNSTNAPVTVTYAITPTANGCAGPVFNYRVTVNPTPTVSSLANGSMCSGNAQNYNILSNVTGTTFIWSRAAVPGINESGLNGQTTSSITEVLTNNTTAPITVTYVINPTANGCTGPTFNYKVTVNPTPSVTSVASASICNNTAQNYIIASNVAGATFTWSRNGVANINNAPVSGQTGSTITEALVNNSNLPVVVTYVITPTANGCSGQPFNYKVTVNPTPGVISAASGAICNNNPQNYIIASNVAGATFTWSRASVAGISNLPVSGQTGSTITETLVNNTNAPIVVKYVITATAYGCTGPAFNYSVTVNPTPAAPTASGATICPGSSATLTATAPGGTYQWYDAASGGTLLFTGATYTTSPLTTTTTYYVQAISTAGCPGPRSAVTVTVRPPVDPTFFYSSGTFCSSAADPTPTIANPTGGTFTSTAGLIIDSTTGKINLSGSALGSYVVTFVTNSICPYSSSLTVTITNAPNATFSYSGPYCQFTPNPLPTFPAGASAGTFSSTNPSLVFKNTSTGEIDLQNTVPGTYTVTNSINIPGCAFASYSSPVTINPTPTVTSVANATTCNKTPQNYVIGSNVPGTTFTWSRAAVAGISNFPVSGQTSGTITEALNNTFTIPVTVTYVITPIANGCTGPTFNYKVTVNPTPVVNSVAKAITCDSTAQNYIINSNVAAATFTWGRAAVAGISNLPISGQTRDTISETLINTSTTPIDVTYVIIPQAYGCNGPAFNYTVTVNPTPIVTSVANATICNSSPQNYSIMSNVPGTTFTWSRNGVAGINNSPVSGQTGNSITETLVNNSTIPVVVTYVIVPRANGCDGPSFNYAVTVNPTPSVISSANTITCNNIPQNYNIASNVSGATFSWSRATVAGISNLPVSGQTSSSITETLNNTSNVPVLVTYVIVPLDGICAGPTFNYTVTVNPTPTVTSVPSAITCNGIPQNYTILSNVAGTTYSWGRAAVTGISNLPVSGQTTSSITETLVNTSKVPVVVNYVITPTANGCTGPDFNYSITVNPTAIVTSAATDTICNNTPQNYTILSNVAGTTFTWSRAAVPNISNLAANAQTSNSITETLTNTSNVPVAVTYVIIPTANGCTGPSFNYVVTVNPTPTVISSANATICNNTPQNYNIASNVPGATFTWSRAAVTGISNLAANGQTSS